MLKKISSFTLFLGILGSITCQGVSGAQTTFKDKGSQVTQRKVQNKEEQIKTVGDSENKEKGDLKKINFLKQDVKTENKKDLNAKVELAKNLGAAPANGAKQSANLNTDSKQPSVSGERLVLSSIDENYDVLFNYLSKKLGFQENWYYLFHTYEGDRLNMVKRIVCYILLVNKWLQRIPLGLFVLLCLLKVIELVLAGNLLAGFKVLFSSLLCTSISAPLIINFPLTSFFLSLALTKSEVLRNLKDRAMAFSGSADSGMRTVQ